MKLIRYGQDGKEATGFVSNEIMYDTSGFGEDYNEVFLDNDGLKRLAAFVELNKKSLPVVDKNVRLDSPVARPSKIICIGLNYADHAKETNSPFPSEPIIFLKSTSALCGPFDEIIIPKNSTKTDWEVELAIVIGKKASYVNEATELDHVVGNDEIGTSKQLVKPLPGKLTVWNINSINWPVKNNCFYFD